MGQAAAQGEAYWRVQVEAWRASGQSRGEYCAAHGLSRKTFGWWAWRLDRQGRPAPAGTAGEFPPGGDADGSRSVRGGALEARSEIRFAPGGWGRGGPGVAGKALRPGPKAPGG